MRTSFPCGVGLVLGIAMLGIAAPAAQAQADRLPRADKMRRILKEPAKIVEFTPNTPFRLAAEELAKAYGFSFRIDDGTFEADTRLDIVADLVLQVPPHRGISLETFLRDLTSRLIDSKGMNEIHATCLIQGDHLVFVARGPRALQRRLHGPVFAAFDRQPLVEALQELSASTGVTIVLDPRASSEEDRRTHLVTATLNGVPLETAVRLLADMNDLKAVVVDQVLYVTTKTNARQLEAEELRRQHGLPPPGAPIG
jgi:hypothetical protein